MTLLDRILERGYEMPIDPIIASRLERHMQRIKPDALFQRRLRGQVVNRYVATREGMVAATRPVRLPRRSLSLLGRGMLYASLLTAVSATAVGAAAQQSLPGDMLYGVKLELESIRMELAPANMRDDLAAMALDERLDEVEALAAAGRWSQVEAAVAAVERAQTTLAALTRPADSGSAAGAVDPAGARRSSRRAHQHGARRREARAAAGAGRLRRLAVRCPLQPGPRDRESRAAQGTAWRSGRTRGDRHATSCALAAHRGADAVPHTDPGAGRVDRAVAVGTARRRARRAEGRQVPERPGQGQHLGALGSSPLPPQQRTG